MWFEELIYIFGFFFSTQNCQKFSRQSHLYKISQKKKYIFLTFFDQFDSVDNEHRISISDKKEES